MFINICLPLQSLLLLLLLLLLLRFGQSFLSHLACDGFCFETLALVQGFLLVLCTLAGAFWPPHLALPLLHPLIPRPIPRDAQGVLGWVWCGGHVPASVVWAGRGARACATDSGLLIVTSTCYYSGQIHRFLQIIPPTAVCPGWLLWLRFHS